MHQPSKEWNENQAIELLENTGMVIKFATSNGKMEVPNTAEHHRRILLARGRRDWDDYVKALQGWSQAACKAAYERGIL